MLVVETRTRIVTTATDFGFIAMATAPVEERQVWCEGKLPKRRIVALTFGWANPQQAIDRLDDVDIEAKQQGACDPDSTEKKWLDRLVRYTDGKYETLMSLPIDITDYTPFQLQVIKACREIPYGETLSYGDLAEIAGSPRAARAVGNVMRTNRYPLVVPCHRVVGSGGSLGGYSAMEGLTTKQRLLEMERRVGKK